MTTTSSQFGDLLEPGLRQILFNRFNQYPEEYAQIFKLDTSQKDKEKESAISGLGVMPEKNKGAGITYDDPIQGFDVTYTHVTYALGFRVERELFEDDLYGKIKRMPEALARSARAAYETVAAARFNSAFDATASGFTYGDGKELCATDHPLLAGGTEQNELSTASDLAVASLQQAINDISDTVDDRNILMALKAVTLVVPSELKWDARTLLGSAQKPGTAQNDSNALLDEDLKFFVWHYLTDADAWFLLIPQQDLEIKFFWRRRLDFGQGNDFDTEDAKFKSTMRFSVGVTDWRGVFGTPGAA